MYTIKENVKNEIMVNKSRFITCLYKVNNVNKIHMLLDNIKKEYKDATHYCYAYIVGNNKKASDDKEPAHTAGMPMLNVLESKKLNNVLAVVIRYFGGVKLGTGGLVRAYSSSVSEAIDKTEIIHLVKRDIARIEFSYENIDMVNYILKDYKVTYKEFGDNIIPHRQPCRTSHH